MRWVIRGILLLFLGLFPATSYPSPLIPSKSLLALVDQRVYEDFPKREDILAVIQVESKFNSKAKGLGGRGLMQVRHGSYDPELNLTQGVQYLRDMYERYGSSRKAFMAYNAGPKAIDQGKGLGFKRASIYVKKILAVRSIYVIPKEESNVDHSNHPESISLDPLLNIGGPPSVGRNDLPSP